MMFNCMPFLLMSLVVFLHQGIRGEERKVMGYIGESVILQSDADPSWNLHEIRWSVYENETLIATFNLKRKQKNDNRFYLFIGRLNLNTTSGYLTINNILPSDALKYRVELKDKENGEWRNSYIVLSVQERLVKPSIQLRHSILDSGYCVISLGCVSMNSKISLSWEPEHGLNESFWSGSQTRAGKSVLWTAFTPNRVVTFYCIAVDGNHNESSQKSVTCPDPEPRGNNTQPVPTVVTYVRTNIRIPAVTAVIVVIIFVGVVVLVKFIYNKCKVRRPAPHDYSPINTKTPEERKLDEPMQYLITQSELNDLVRDLGLSKAQGELLDSRLQEWCMMSPVRRPAPHDDIPLNTKTPEERKLDEPVEETAILGTGSAIHLKFEPCSSGDPHLITQPELNDLVRDLGLSKAQGELLG